MTKKIYQSEVDFSKNPLENYSYFTSMADELEARGANVVVENIDIDDFKCWLSMFSNIDNQYRGCGDVYIEKCLEHYLSYKLLDFLPTDVFMDVAASGSQYANELYYAKKVKQTYLLDLAYAEGINGIKIGANAGDMRLPKNFVDKMSMHCAYECFEGNADIGFLKEASTVLNKNGKFVITPLYLDKTYYNCTSEKCDQSEIQFDSKALKVWRDDEYSVPFSRHYSPESLCQRVIHNMPSNIQYKLYFFENLPELMREFVGQRIYCYFLLYGEKND
ncbi:hypothetical protein JWV37_06700 [Sulfurospirillum sp. T05]|uniref:Methyltransferase type 11 domain-containing protein n=1 Tax=Sulfurospirillum tamanense TaxID=2813362 RepID=A0ABS2WS71_9BACT|nr:hypothetical protein [Sulfurospirillum tamanensis]MBN2964462.1 hypothetical protein [Sulfurospirillum tamanensis]